MRNYLIPLVLLMAMSATAQQQHLSGLDLTKSNGHITAHRGTPVRCGGSANTQGVDPDWQPILTRKINEIEHEGPDEEYIERVKAEKLQQKQEYERTHPNVGAKTTSVTPAVGTNFAGNLYNFNNPLDNTVAISNGGKIVSVINSEIQYYSSSGGAATFTSSLTSLLPFSVGGVCDPVVTYDPERDRFILFCQEWPFSVGGQIFLCFSKTNDPAAGWWCYSFFGDPEVGHNDGFDYPKVAINDSEVFVTGNEYLLPGGPFHQSVIFQFNKLAGYTGGTVDYVYYTGITDNPFTLLPLQAGQSTNITTGMVFVAARSSGGTALKLYEVVGNWCCSPVLYDWTVSTTPYSVAGNAAQLGSVNYLKTGDCRALSGFYLNGTAHFVFNSDGGSGYNGINYNRMDLSGATPVNVSSVFSTSGYDNAYAAVASFATSATDKSVMIGYGRSGSTIRPEIRAVNCDNSMGWSASTLVKASTSYAGVTNPTRWGDYTGISRKHNSTTASVWISGMVSNSSHNWDTWIAELHSGTPTEIADEAKNDAKARVFPNPVANDFTIEFPIAENTNLTIFLTDVTGRMVKELYEGKVSAGDNVFSFNKANLAAGTYFLHIKSGTQIIKNEKIVIAD